MEDQHYLISPYKNLRFIRFRIHVKQKFTILVTTQKIGDNTHSQSLYTMLFVCKPVLRAIAGPVFIWKNQHSGPGLHPKTQISILPPGKYQGGARFREGVLFSRPSSPVNVRFYAAGTPFSASGMVFLIFRYRLSGSALII